MDRISIEIRRRIRVSIWAYEYEILNGPSVSDNIFDQECLLIDLNISTSYKGRDNSKIDNWFRENFKPYTGQWIHNHPNKNGLLKYIKK